MKKNESKKILSNPKKSLIYSLIALMVVVLGKCGMDAIEENEAEKMNATIVAINISKTPQPYETETLITPTPTEEIELVGELLYEEENAFTTIAQGMNVNDFITFNPRTIGTISIPGTSIYFPICDSTSDSEWLETLFNGKDSVYGTTFLDFTNNKDFTSKVSTLFGHNMSDGKMFAGLNKYMDSVSYYKNHNYAFISTKDYIYVYKFACAAKILETDLQDLRTSDFDNNEEYKKNLELLEPRIKSQDDSVNLNDADKVLQLITCCGSKKYRTGIYFAYQYSIPNVLSCGETTEEIQNNIGELTRRKNNFGAMNKNVISYSISSDMNYIYIETLNSEKFIWTLKKLTTKEEEKFVEAYNINLNENYTFISGYNYFNLNGTNININMNNDTVILICEGQKGSTKEQNIISSLKTVKSGNMYLGMNKNNDMKLIRDIK